MTAPERRTPASSLHWPLALVALAVVLAAGVWLVVDRMLDTVDETSEAAVDGTRELVGGVGDIAERFLSGRITTTFTAAIPQLAPGDGLKLEVAAYEATEILTRQDDRRAFFDLVDLGTTVTEIRVPVTYRYHLRLDEPWHLTVRDRTCVVRAPKIRPTLPPAIHTDRLERHLDSGWLRFDDAEQMAALEHSITPALSARAGNRAHLELIRDSCRRRVAEFVRGWLLAEDHWREDRFTAVVVTFADEDPAPADTGPTLELARPERE